MSDSRCKSCRAAIRWARTTAGRAIPLDYLPDDAGRFVVERRGRDVIAVEVRELLPLDEPDANSPEDVGHTGPVQPPRETPRYTSHFATCPQAAQHRRRR